MKKFPDEYRREVAEMYGSGMSCLDIYKATGHSFDTTVAWAREFNVPIRGNSEAMRLKSTREKPYLNEEGILVKNCFDCKFPKPLSEFQSSKSNVDGRRRSCNECRNKKRRAKYSEDPEVREKATGKQKRGRKDDPERFRAYDIKKRFRLTPEAYEELFEAQGRKCAGCGSEDSGEKYRSWHIDHDHSCCPDRKRKTCGKCVRGILCRWCNLTLGNAKEDANRLRSLADYVDRLSSVTNSK